MDPLVERACKENGIELHRKNILLSAGYLLVTLRKPPLLVVDGKVVLEGFTVTLDVLRQLLGTEN